MKHFFGKLKRKLKGNSGMSISEVLVAVLIMLLVTSTMVRTVSMASNFFLRDIRESDAKVLCSSLRTIMESELAYTEEITEITGSTPDETEYWINCPDYGNGIFRSDASGKNGYGKLVFAVFSDASSGSFDNPESSLELLASGSYPNGLTAKIARMKYENNYFTVVLSIGYNGKEIYQESFQVMNANQRTAS